MYRVHRLDENSGVNRETRNSPQLQLPPTGFLP